MWIHYLVDRKSVRIEGARFSCIVWAYTTPLDMAGSSRGYGKEGDGVDVGWIDVLLLGESSPRIFFVGDSFCKTKCKGCLGDLLLLLSSDEMTVCVSVETIDVFFSVLFKMYLKNS